MASVERSLALVGLKSREEVGSGRTISLLERVPKGIQLGYVPEEILLASEPSTKCTTLEHLEEFTQEEADSTKIVHTSFPAAMDEDVLARPLYAKPSTSPKIRKAR